MANSYSRKIQERIRNAAEGTVFIVADFADIADTETVRRNLNRLTQAGLIRRILKGVYEKPEYSEMLKEYVAADPEVVIKVLARNYHWCIAPYGNTAHKMGLNDTVVEKDFWVCFTLDYLYHRSPWMDFITFKGGTSLSKAFNLIYSFSEDIDLILDW